MSPEQYKDIADNIKRLRKLNNLTQEQTAEALYLDTQYYAQLERCTRRFTIDKIVQLCDFFDVDIDEIVKFSSETNRNNETIGIIRNIHEKLEGLSHNQLKILERYIDEILPLSK